MRKTGFFPRLALVNLVRNGRYYGPYLLSCGGTAAMYYILRFLTWNDMLRTVRGALYVRSMMGIGCFVVALFSAVILLYANSFVMKRRARELGLYNVLGMEKRHIARLMVWETAYCAAVSLAGGLLAGVLLSKLTLLALLKLIHIPVQFGFSVSGRGLAETASLLGALFVLTLLSNLLRLGRSDPIQLLRGGETGEREPKTKKLLTALGLGTLLAGYAVALVTRDPVEALVKFFLAVALVMLGTYCLFTAGSIALLKHLRARPDYYYQTRHFTAVSGMLHRMKQNAVGLANICILSCMVLVTVSGTVCLYLGAETSLDRLFPYDVEVLQDLEHQPGDTAQTVALTRDAVAASGRTAEHLGYYTSVTSGDGEYGGNTLRFERGGGAKAVLEVVTAEDYGRLTGRTVQLAADQVLVYAAGADVPETFYIGERPFRVAERLTEPLRKNDGRLISPDTVELLLVVADEAAVQALWQENPTANFTAMFRIQLDLDGTDAEKLSCFDAILTTDGIPGGSSRQDNERDFYAMYGGFLFLGTFLGVLFLMTTVLIIYYKQISEGYEDQRRYQIMRQVGMTDREVRASVRSQILLVFFLPLGAAALHIAVAFPMLAHILELFNLYDLSLFALCTAGTLLAFAAVYVLVFALTARTYDRIVSAAPDR